MFWKYILPCVHRLSRPCLAICYLVPQIQGRRKGVDTGRSVNPIQPGEGAADYAHTITTCTSRVLDDAPPLQYML